MSYMEELIKEEMAIALAEVSAIAEEMANGVVEQKKNPTIKNLTEPEISPELNKRLLIAGFKINLFKGLM